MAKIIGKWIQTTNTFNQCFLSTHSPDFLDVFTDEFKHGNVAVFVFDNREQKIKKIVYQDIADELGDWELGALYRTSDPALGRLAVVNRIACFLTCGYTEAGAMQIF